MMNELTVEAKKECLDQVLAFVDELLEQQDCPMKAQMQIDVAVEELFVNIASYAYVDGSGMATVRVKTGTRDASELSEKRDSQEVHTVEITFIDSGTPYNPLEKEDPDITLSVEERPIGGLGIFMVKKTMDEVRYEHTDGQNVLTIVKKF